MNLVTLTPFFKTISDGIDQALQGIGYVVSGCAPTAHGAGTLQVDIALGTYFDTSTRRTYAGGNVTPGAADPTNPRRDLIYFPAGGGAPLVAAGTAAVTPLPPAIPANGCPIAIAFIPAAATDYSAGFPGAGVEDMRIIHNFVTNPMTSSGDMIFGGASGLPTRIAIGGDGSFLNVSGSVIRWGNTINAGGLTITAGGVTITAGGLTIAAGGADITGTLTARSGIAFNGDLGQNIGTSAISLSTIFSRVWTTSAGNDNVINLVTNRDLIFQNNGVEKARLTGADPQMFTLGTTAGGGGKFIASGTITAGGLLTSAVQIGTSGPLIYSGSGVPTISAAVKGSLYLRTDGASNVTRAYIATDTAGTWTAVNTVA